MIFTSQLLLLKSQFHSYRGKFENVLCCRRWLLFVSGGLFLGSVPLVVWGQLFKSVFVSAELSQAPLQLNWVEKLQCFDQTAPKLLTIKLVLLRQGSAQQG